MAHALHDPIRHNVWANRQLLEFLRGVDAEILNATVPGTYGTIVSTLRHIIYCELEFLERLLGRKLSEAWHLDEITEFDALIGFVTLLAREWENLLASDIDGEKLLPPDAGRSPIPAGVVIAVVIYHGSEHRGQVCTILGALGHEPPDLTPWAYARATGRIRG